MTDPKQVAFMVMPYGKRKVDVGGEGVPHEIDFDALWEKVYVPVLREEYEAVRADADLGALIIKEMIERLVLADLVLADITLQNPNVYYEVGVRHAAQEAGCVLLAAQWSKQAFDLQQMPHLRYPLGVEGLTDASVAELQSLLKKNLPAMRQGQSPVHGSLKEYPKLDAAQTRRLRQDATSFRDFVKRMAEFQGQVRSIHVAAPEERAERALKLVQEVRAGKEILPGIALELLYLLRDTAGFKAVLEFVAKLPPAIRALPVVREQESLALAKSGDVLASVAMLEALLQDRGESSERLGILGGRYKTLARDADNKADRRRYLNLAIDAYERGSQLDRNDYYPACNLPRLYRRRGAKGDEEKAERMSYVALASVESARLMRPSDPWSQPTLLGAAFDAGDAARAKELLDEIESAGPAPWMLKTTLADLKESLDLLPTGKNKTKLAKVLRKLQKLIPPEDPAGAG